MAKKIQRKAAEPSESKEGNLAVLHIIKGAEIAHPDGREKGIGEVRVHVSLAFVSGVKMPFLPFQPLYLKEDFEKKIAQKMEILHRGGDSDGIKAAADPPKITTRNKRSMQFSEAHRASLPDSTGDTSVIRRVKTTGDEIVNTLRFETMFGMLYDLRDKIKQLHIVTNMSYIPWDLLYYKQENVFLSDLFGIGLSARPKNFEDSADEIKKYLHSAKRSDSGTRTAVHFYCGYQQETVDPLPEIGSAVHQISEELLRSFDADSIINIGVEDSYQIPNTLREHENTVELIIFSGHFERNGYVYEVDGEKRHFGFDEMPKEIVFLRRPIVILGGCATFASGAPNGSRISTDDRTLWGDNEGQKYALHNAFFERGACACVVASNKIQFAHYRRIMTLLMRELAKSKTSSLGRSVWAVR